MEVIVNKPEPQPEPPTTYDLIGLSQEELDHLYTVVASCAGRKAGLGLFQALRDAGAKDLGSAYAFSDFVKGKW